MSLPCHGRVIWVTIPDPQGRNPKCRPAIILTPTDEITPDGEVRVVGITTRFESAAPELRTELQYDPGGTAVLVCVSARGLLPRGWNAFLSLRFRIMQA